VNKKKLNLKNDFLIEEVAPLFFDKLALREPRQRLNRIYTPKGRYYYTIDEAEHVSIYLGVTTMIGKLVPKGEGLIKWMVDMGFEKSRIYASVRAAYGTLMHELIADFLINRIFNLDTIPDRVDHVISTRLTNVEQPTVDRSVWIEDLVTDILAFAQFCSDHKVKPVAIEVMLTHPDGYAGTIDLLCFMTIREKIDPDKKWVESNTSYKTVLAAVDFKSGRKGFYDEHAIQLESYRHLIHNEWPDLYVEKIYNWSPKDWRTNPDYNLKDQSSSVDAKKFELLVDLAKVELMKVPGSFMVPKGTIELGKEFEPNILEKVDIIDFIVNYHRNKSKEPYGLPEHP
jgi:hypothetical protein